MSETEESPAQRQARIRREKREAKIKAGGNERLEKITRLSGRNPEMSQSKQSICWVVL
jgi:GET complex subunit GET2